MISKAARLDPTKTALIRRQFTAEMKKRFKELAKAVLDFMVTKDALGLKPPEPFVPLAQNVAAKQFAFSTDPQKMAAYKSWFQSQVDAKVLEVDRKSRPWLAKYVDSSYRKAAAEAYSDVHKDTGLEKLDFYKGRRQEFLRSSFGSPEATSKIEMLYTRAFDELKDVTSTMGNQMGRILAAGMAGGKAPMTIAREMSQSIGAISRKRAEVISRTEIIHAHAEGQLDAFKALGIEEVGVMAEFSTAGDALVCPECAGYEGKVYKVEESHNIIPVHPNCRCTWMPVTKEAKVEAGEAQKKIEVEKSVGGEEKGVEVSALPITEKTQPTTAQWYNSLPKKQQEMAQEYLDGMDTVMGVRASMANDSRYTFMFSDAQIRAAVQLKESVKAAPSYGGTVWRGTGVDELFISGIDNYGTAKVGDVVTYKSIASAATKRKAAEEFLVEAAGWERMPVLLEIRGKSLMDVTTLSSTARSNSEVWIKPDTKYKLVSKQRALTKTKITVGGESEGPPVDIWYFKVTLKEI